MQQTEITANKSEIVAVALLHIIIHV